MSLLKEIQWFNTNQELLSKLYPNKFVVVRDCKIIFSCEEIWFALFCGRLFSIDGRRTCKTYVKPHLVCHVDTKGRYE